MHATTIGWPDQVNSETSVADLIVTVAGTNIGADFVMSRASAKLGFGSDGTVNIEVSRSTAFRSRSAAYRIRQYQYLAGDCDQRTDNVTNEHVVTRCTLRRRHRRGRRSATAGVQ